MHIRGMPCSPVLSIVADHLGTRNRVIVLNEAERDELSRRDDTLAKSAIRQEPGLKSEDTIRPPSDRDDRQVPTTSLDRQRQRRKRT